MKKPERPYDQSSRHVHADLTRVLVLQAARDLLAQEAEAAKFTLDAVALRAGVSRATVFNLFGGKPGLLNALFDQIAEKAGLMDVDALLMQDDPCRALAEYIRRFGDFYDAQRAVLRKLRAYAGLDTDFSRVMQARDDKRTAGLLFLIQRLPEGNARPASAQRRLAAKLKALLVLEVFESIAGPGKSLRAASAVVLEMAKAILHFPSLNGSSGP